jgi:hypothetical protein
LVKALVQPSFITSFALKIIYYFKLKGKKQYSTVNSRFVNFGYNFDIIEWCIDAVFDWRLIIDSIISQGPKTIRKYRNKTKKITVRHIISVTIVLVLYLIVTALLTTYFVSSAVIRYAYNYDKDAILGPIVQFVDYGIKSSWLNLTQNTGLVSKMIIDTDNNMFVRRAISNTGEWLIQQYAVMNTSDGVIAKAVQLCVGQSTWCGLHLINDSILISYDNVTWSATPGYDPAHINVCVTSTICEAGIGNECTNIANIITEEYAQYFYPIHNDWSRYLIFTLVIMFGMPLTVIIFFAIYDWISNYTGTIVFIEKIRNKPFSKITELYYIVATGLDDEDCAAHWSSRYRKACYKIVENDNYMHYNIIFELNDDYHHQEQPKIDGKVVRGY